MGQRKYIHTYLRPNPVSYLHACFHFTPFIYFICVIAFSLKKSCCLCLFLFLNRRPPAGQELLPVARAGSGWRFEHHGRLLPLPPPHVRGLGDVFSRPRIFFRLLHPHRSRLSPGIRLGELKQEYIFCTSAGVLL